MITQRKTRTLSLFITLVFDNLSKLENFFYILNEWV